MVDTSIRRFPRFPAPSRQRAQEEVVAASFEKRCTAADEKAYLDLAQELLVISPPVLAYVPDRWPDGRPKNVRGWQVGIGSALAMDNPTVYCNNPVSLFLTFTGT